MNRSSSRYIRNAGNKVHPTTTATPEREESNYSSDDDDEEYYSEYTNNLVHDGINDRNYDDISYLQATYERIMHEFSYQNVKEYSLWLLEHAGIEFRLSFDDLSFALTLYALFAPSIVYLAAPKSNDYIFEIVTTICFSFFVFELVIATWCKTTFRFGYRTLALNVIVEYIDVSIPAIRWKGFFGSLIWFLDVIVIVSLFPDIPAIARATNLSSYALLTTASARLFRMLRLFRIIKAYYLINERRNQYNQQLKMLTLVQVRHVDLHTQLEMIEKNKKRPSKLGEQLAESTTTRVVILILVLVICIPFLIYAPSNQVYNYATNMMQAINMNNELSKQFKNMSIDLIIVEMKDLSTPILYLDIFPYQNGTTIVDDWKQSDLLRALAILSKNSSYYNITSNNSKTINYFTFADYNIDYFIRLRALYTIILIIFVGVIAFIASVTFTRDTENLVLKPIERMMRVVEAIAKSPLSKIRFDHDTLFGSFETNLLEKTFIKIAGLLRVGFGEAGAGIIKANLKLDVNNPSSAIINPLLPGIRVYCIVGFCDIHQFDFVLKRLAQDVLTFVNTIAAIVHEQVHSWEGSCNKNLGNAFVIIWRIGEESALASYTVLEACKTNGSNSFLITDADVGKTGGRAMSFKGGGGGGGNNNNSPSSKSNKGNGGNNNNNNIGGSGIHFLTKYTRQDYDSEDMDGETTNIQNNSKYDLRTHAEKQKYQKVDLRRLPGVDKLAAKALIGFLKVISELNRNESLYRYHVDKRLESNDGDLFEVKMGFGLHAGWAIEGAVGSLQKVDATYLSPHVNMAARLETASRQYGVPLLVSQDFYDLLSPYIQKYMRRLDVVTVKGSETAIGIYTYDTLARLKKPMVRNSINRKSDGRISGRYGANTMRVSGAGMTTRMSAGGLANNGNGSPLPPGGTAAGGHTNGGRNGRVQGMLSGVLTGAGVGTSSSILSVPGLKLTSTDSIAGNNNNIHTPNGPVPSTARKSVRVAETSGNSPSNTARNTGRKSVRVSTHSGMTTANATGGAAGMSVTTANGDGSGGNTAGSRSPSPSPDRPPRIIRKRSEYFQRQVLTAHNDPEEVFERDRDVVYLRSHVATLPDFTQVFTEGVNKYIAGDWLAAKELFLKTTAMMSGCSELSDHTCDGPSETLLKYMASFQFIPPPTWQGFRPLTSK